MPDSTLTPRAGHVVGVTQRYSCDFCGEPATWDIPTHFGPWANACDEHEAMYHRYPGKTGVGVGQRITLIPDVDADGGAAEPFGRCA